MKRRREKDKWIDAIEDALYQEDFVSYGRAWEFVHNLGQVKEKLDAFAADDPECAVEVYEVFLSGCYDKADDIDDSSGGLGDFFQDLFLSWVKVRQQAKCDAEQTVRQILAWIENDDYGFAYEIEKQVAAVLGKTEYRLFVQHYQEQCDRAYDQLEKKELLPISKYPNAFRLPAMALRDIYMAKKDFKSYLKLLERYTPSPKDCMNLASTYQAKRKYAEALEWVQRGLPLENRGKWGNETTWGLKGMKQKLLHKVGRSQDALQAAWDEFRKHPSDYSYDDFMQYVPKSDRKTWHAKAMDVAKKGNLHGFMELCTKTKEWEQLAQRVASVKHPSLEALGHFVMEPAAKGLERQFKPEAAKLYRALGIRIVKSGKSKYYANALDHLRKAKQCYQKSSLHKEWDALVAIIRKNHSRKYSFITGFEDIVSDGARPAIESFSTKAKKRWKKQTTL